MISLKFVSYSAEVDTAFVANKIEITSQGIIRIDRRSIAVYLPKTKAFKIANDKRVYHLCLVEGS